MSDASDARIDVGRSVRAVTDSRQMDQSNVVYDRWILQVRILTRYYECYHSPRKKLAPLASQHHLSEYSRLKYGRHGCPVAYAPLSLHLPDVVRGLRERQEKYADKVLWWPCTSTTPVGRESRPLLIPAARQRDALATGETIPHPDLQLELFNALSESIPAQPQRLLHIKTSESHPINVSPIIPPESLVAISSHLIPCKRRCPVLFEINIPYSLDRIAGHHPHQVQLFHPVGSVPVPSVLPSISQHKHLPSSDLRSSVSGALNAALNTKLSLPALPIPSSKILLSFKRNLKSHIASDGTSEINAMNEIPKLVPYHTILPSTQMPLQIPQSRLPSTLPTTYALHPFVPYVRAPTAPSPPKKVSKFRALKPSSTRQGTANQKPFKLGNLLLSSCPGKKVRLNGPARGRSAVCRDLEVDLRRMKMLGARCVVCCLDDDELEFLIGVSWAKYCQVAHREGLDVLRIPLPEGLAPLSPQSLDADLDRIIERYTLQGISVLVHCRGGVGRAGLFACCWMLKLGLCGWIETDVLPTTTSDDAPPQWNTDTIVRRGTLQLVERAIEVARRRRSVKAIETLEQVQFLVEYVDYLRTCGRIGGDSSNS